MLSDTSAIHLIPVLAANADKARSFYEQTLGLRFIADDGFALVFEVDGRFLRLTRVPQLTPQPFSVIAWQVSDIDATVRGLIKAGVSFNRIPQLPQDDLGIWTTPDGVTKVAWFRDPDGNELSLVQSPHDRPTEANAQ